MMLVKPIVLVKLSVLARLVVLMKTTIFGKPTIRMDLIVFTEAGEKEEAATPKAKIVVHAWEIVLMQASQIHPDFLIDLLFRIPTGYLDHSNRGTSVSQESYVGSTFLSQPTIDLFSPSRTIQKIA